MQAKNPNDVRGVRIDCPSYEKCTLCFGCRAFNPHYEECRQCEAENKKQNICNTEKHKAHLVAKMITKTKVVVK